MILVFIMYYYGSHCTEYHVAMCYKTDVFVEVLLLDTLLQDWKNSWHVKNRQTLLINVCCVHFHIL